MGNVSFTNRYTTKIWVSYMRLDYACKGACGDPWDVLGWINLEVGQTQTRSNPTNNRWFYYYAEAKDGGVWAGTYPAQVTPDEFHACNCVDHSSESPPWHTILMRRLDLQQYAGVIFTA